jgi:hypothetical protein
LTLKDSSGSAINVTNATLDSEIKQDFYFPPLASFVITKVNAVGGVVKLELPAAQTAVLHPGVLKYDLLIKYSDNSFQKILKGNVYIDPNISNLS